MGQPRKKADGIVVAGVVCCLILATIGAYVGCYFWRCKSLTRSLVPDKLIDSGDYFAYREYDTEWEARLFVPAAKVESWIIGHVVITISLDIP